MPAIPAEETGFLACARMARGVVATLFGVSSEDLVTPTRASAKVAFARQIAMYLTHVVFAVSYTRVGAAFGRDRTTAAHACRVIEAAREDADIDHVVERLGAALRAIARNTRTSPTGRALMTRAMSRITSEELADEARRVLPHLTRGERVLAAADGGGYGLFDMKTFRQRTDMRISGAVLDALRAQRAHRAPAQDRRGSAPDALCPHRRRPRLSRARALSAGEPFADQHRIRVRGEGAVPRVGGATPLEWLKMRKGAGGEALIAEAEAAAGERLHRDFSRALTSASPRAAWPQERIDASRRIDFSPTESMQSAEVARGKFWRAVEAVGPELAPVVVAVACHLKPLEAVEAALGLPARSAKSLLKAGLMALARHYGLGPVRQTRTQVLAAASGPLP